MTTSKMKMHKLGLGVCKRENCKYAFRQVPVKKWDYDGDRYTCPECGYGIAPDGISKDLENYIKETFFRCTEK